MSAMSARRLSAMRAADAFTESRAEVGVAHRRLYLPVAEQLADHGQAFAERKGAGRARMSEIVDAHVFQVGSCPDDEPGIVEIAQSRAGLGAGNHPGVVGQARQAREHPPRMTFRT